MHQTQNSISVEIQESIERLKNGTATRDDISLVKDYLVLVEEMIDLFDETMRSERIQSALQ